jgi:hypothetical protein
MKRFGRRGFLMTAAGLAAWCAGCSPGQMAYFLLPESKADPGIRKLASDDKKQQIKIAIVASTQALPTSVELMNADRQLAMLLAKQLFEQCQANDENVLIVGPQKVEEYKSTHPDWKDKGEREIGKHFGADYVIVLEIRSISLYERGSFNTVYRGQIDLGVDLIDIKHPDEPLEHRDYTDGYPEKNFAEAVDNDKGYRDFREKFLNHVAKRIAWYFTPHRHRDTYMSMD